MCEIGRELVSIAAGGGLRRYTNSPLGAATGMSRGVWGRHGYHCLEVEQGVGRREEGGSRWFKRDRVNAWKGGD